MKIWYFVKWGWAKLVNHVKSWDHWMWAWMITCGWGPTAFLYRSEYPNSWNLFVALALIFWGLYGVVYTGIKRAYNKFLAEQERMVEHLKDMG